MQQDLTKRIQQLCTVHSTKRHSGQYDDVRTAKNEWALEMEIQKAHLSTNTNGKSYLKKLLYIMYMEL